MDGLLFIIMAIAFVILDSKSAVDDSSVDVEDAVYETGTRVTKLNEEFYDDPQAFSAIINALGFPKGR